MQIKARVKDKDLINKKRIQIIEGAIKVFKKKGFHKSTVREIAEEAKIGLGSIYNYVSSKDDILYLFFENYANTFYDKLKSQASQIKDPVLRLAFTYWAFVEASMEVEDQVMLAYTQSRYVKKKYLKLILHRESDIIEVFRKNISEIGEGPFGAFLEANFLVFSGVFGILRRWILNPKCSHRETIDFLVQSQIKGVIERIQDRTISFGEIRSWLKGFSR
jgi:AcrR family transcriptional regulator